MRNTNSEELSGVDKCEPVMETNIILLFKGGLAKYDICVTYLIVLRTRSVFSGILSEINEK